MRNTTINTEALSAALVAAGHEPLTSHDVQCINDEERTGEALDMLDDLRARVLTGPCQALDDVADAVGARRPFWTMCADDLPRYWLTHTDAAEALAEELRSIGAIHDREGEPHVTAALNAAATEMENSSNHIDERAAGIPYALGAYNPSDINAAIARLASAFCRILRATIGDEETDEAARLNAQDRDPNICRSHDYCDANEVMSEAWLQVWHREAMTCDEDDASACDTPAADQVDTGATDTPAADTASDCTEARETMPEAPECTTQDETPPAAIEPAQADPAAALRRAYTWHATDAADPLGQHGQRINSKGGNWRAAFYRIGDRLHMAIRARDGFETVPSFDTAAERVRALQHIGATLDATGGRLAAISTATSAPDFRTLDQYPENLEGAALAQWFSIATSSQAAAEYWQDALDHINGGRIVATRNALRVWGWEADTAAWPMTFCGCVGLRLDVWHVGAGRNVARVTWTASNGAAFVDDLSMTPEQLGSYIHAATHPGDTPPSNDTPPAGPTRTASEPDAPSADTLRQQADGFTAEQCEQIAAQFEDQNHHGAALMWRCIGAQAFDLAARAAANIKAHDRAGSLTPTIGQQREAISDELRQRTASRCTEAHETHASAPDCTAPHETQEATAAPAFQRAKPEHVDLRHFIAAGLEPAQLVGVGVVYTGDAANAGGQGAIVSATSCASRGVRVAVTLEDGRHMDHLDAYSFSDRPGSRFAINAKIHGAPYLAELSAARAARVASAEAAKTSKEQHHAAELVRLAAEFPHLQRKGQNDRGGVFAARNIRTMLKGAFPGVKFSVTSDYNSVRVRWTDGPTDAQVTATIGRFDIGRADYSTDYFYTTSTAFSDLFGGVQFLFTNRDESPELVAATLQAFNTKHGTSATPEEWRKQSGPFSYSEREGDARRRWFRQMLNDTEATPPAKTSKRAG